MLALGCLHEVKVRVRHNWTLIASILVPLILSPMVWAAPDVGTEANTSAKFKTAYVIIIMGVFWVLEILPLAITSLFPLVLFPLLGVQDAAVVSKNYMKESNMIFLGAIILALAIEYCGLHIRVALRIISIFGAHPARIMFGVMIVTATLSMWISDTSCTTMLIPIVSAIITGMFREEQEEVLSHDEDVDEISAPSEGSIGGSRGRRESFVFGNPSLQGSVPRRRSRRSNSSGINHGAPPAHPAVTQKDSKDTPESGLSIDEMTGLDDKHRQGSTESGIPTSPSSHSIRAFSSMSIIQEGVAVEGAPRNGSIDQRLQVGTPNGDAERGERTDTDEDDTLEFQTHVRKMLLLAVAYSANIGGTGSLIGTGPIKVFKELAKKYKLEKTKDLVGTTFFTWMGFNVPPLMVNIVLTWLFLALRYLGLHRLKTRNEKLKGRQKIQKYLVQEYKKLGPITSHEIGVLVIFLFVVLLWLLRDPQLFDGWDSLDKTTDNGDSTAAMLGVILLFIIPRDWSFLKCGKEGYKPKAKYESLLDWKFVSTNAPWGYVLLIGSGYALADAADTSGLAKYIGTELRLLQHIPKPALLMIVMIMTSIISEFASNTAAANLILPILFSLSCKINIHPLYLTMTSAVAASYGFMLPISSPPNAIIFATGHLSVREMIWNGLIINVFCVVIFFVAVITYGELIFQFSHFSSYSASHPEFICNME